MDKAEKAAYNKEYKQKNKEAIKAYNKEYRQKNKEAIAEQRAGYRKANAEVLVKKTTEYQQAKKANITYIITLGSEYYFGHTSRGLDLRRSNHFADLRRNKGCLGIQKRFDELSEEAFKKIFDIQILGTYDTKEEAEEQERYLLSKYVGTAGCLNIHTW